MRSTKDVCQEDCQIVKIADRIVNDIQDGKQRRRAMNNWTIEWRMRHVGVRYSHLRKSKEKGIVKVEWIRLKEIRQQHLHQKLE
jgi:hypothetical protein